MVAVLSDLLSAEDALPVCSEFAEENWDEEFMAGFGHKDKLLCPDEDSKNEDKPERLPCLSDFREAVACLEEVRYFLEYRGYTSAATDANTLTNNLAELQYTSQLQATKQTSITDFFS